jgi:hypothetical protein
MHIERIERKTGLSLRKPIKIHISNNKTRGTTICILEDSFKIVLNGYRRSRKAMKDRDFLGV